jgi:hypothetical protein
VGIPVDAGRATLNPSASDDATEFRPTSFDGERVRVTPDGVAVSS